ncbi:hypothetical protein HIM_00844 [Hirsutella minnesotensis 3608]|nr:hypothetical protein HIM_00844 [Hirsutella minnesotensis 3608]
MTIDGRFWYGVVTFGMGLHIPAHELDTCRSLMAPAWAAVALQNDLFSWPKEHDAAQRRRQGHVVNAIWVLMQEHGAGVVEVPSICRQYIKKHVAEYVQIVQDSKGNMLLSRDLRKYVEAMPYSISGNIIWSLSCPRYNPRVSFNKAQLEGMHRGGAAWPSC